MTHNAKRPNPQPHPRHHAARRAAWAVAAAMLVAAVGSAQAQGEAPQAQRGAQHSAHPLIGLGLGLGLGHGMAGLIIPARALDAIGASAEQKARLRDIFKAALDDLSAGREARQASRAQLQALLAAPQIDRGAAEALRQQDLAWHDTAGKRLMQAMLDAQAVLTPEQRQQLSERLKAQRAGRDRHHRERRASDAPRS